MSDPDINLVQPHIPLPHLLSLAGLFFDLDEEEQQSMPSEAEPPHLWTLVDLPVPLYYMYPSYLGMWESDRSEIHQDLDDREYSEYHHMALF